MPKKPSTAVKRKYNERAYDQVTVFLPKGSKDYIKRHAARRNISMAQFVTDAVLYYTGRAGRSWDDVIDNRPTILPQHTIEDLVKMQ